LDNNLFFVLWRHRANTDFAPQLTRGLAALLLTCGDKDMSVWTVADETLNKVIKVHATPPFSLSLSLSLVVCGVW
jgi:hypothetical protein